jgi:hypothetical protein
LDNDALRIPATGYSQPLWPMRKRTQMTRTTLTILILVIGSRLFGQSLTKFDYSECLKDFVGDSSKIVDIKKSGRLTTINLKTYAPCNGNLTGGLETADQRLNLKFWTKSTIITDKKGKKKEIIEVADCNCLIDFKYQIRDLPTVDIKEIRVNGLTLQEIDSKNILTEIEIK